ncbi:EAL domain-containing protein [Acholeplasma laidlawii]|uniref:EAL domain-containing protein n=1 Tax=Acholeplasma laidlawii TaxID=2148 RepID=UPI003F928443
MRNYITKTLLSMLILYALVMGVFFSFYLYYSQDFTTKQARIYGNQVHEMYRENLNSNLKQNHSEFLSYIELYSDVDTLNTNLESMKFGNMNFIKFYNTNDSGIIIDGTTYMYSSIDFEESYNMNITFYKFSEILEGINDNTLYGVFKINNIIGVFDARDYLSQFLPSNAYNSIIIRSNGLILASQNEINAKILSDYLQASTTSLVNEAFANNQSDLKWVTMSGTKYGMTYAPLTDDLPLYYLTFFAKEELINQFGEINLFFLAALIVVGTIFILSNLVIFYLTYLKFDEVENSRLKVYYNHRVMMRISKHGKITSFNKAFKLLFADYKKYKKITDFILDDTSADITVIDKVKRLYAFNILIETDQLNYYIKLTPIKMGFSYILVGENMTEEDMNLRAYESLALVSRVTNLPNYNFFVKYFNEQIKTKSIYNDKYTIIGINVTDFKRINKLIGESSANQILKDFSTIIQKTLTNVEYSIFNTYVDNFFITFKNSLNIDQVEKWFEDLLTNVEAQAESLGSNLQLDLRAGIYEIKLIMGEEITAKQIYTRVMNALKYANNSVTLKYVRYDVTLRNLISQQKKVELGLIQSIEKNEFQIYLQPQFDISRNKIVSFESLIRWSNPEFSNVKPQDFIKLAEESNLIVKIGLIAMEETMKLAKQLEKYNVTIAMNVSPVQMIQKGFVSLVEGMLKKYDIKPGRIAIEITETTMISSLQMISEKLKSLQKLGIDIHLDDFGMGYSSLLYLKDLPINMIKIDKGFIDHITTDKYSKAIANMVVTLSKNIGVDVIAEGVETKVQVEQLKKIGVNIIQGYYISKAIPYNEVLTLLKTYNGE